MKLLPLQQFKCDACGHIVERPEAGWVEWPAGPTRGTKAHGFRIVHNSSQCQYPSTGRVHDIHLLHLLGPDGLATLLVLLAPGGRTGNREEGVVSPDDWGELVRRLHIPHYEGARQYWADAEADGFFNCPARHAPYSQATLLDILNRYGHGANGDEHTNE
ncbi:MAG: hypothetical protein ACXVCX_14655 [Ktedonobacterales bacterium]